MVKRGLHLLTDKKVQNHKSTKPLRDGGGLFFQVRESGSKDWFYLYKVDGKQRKKGLGSYPTVSLALARDEAQKYREWRKKGLDPIAHEKQLKDDRKVQAAQERATAKTFEKCTEEYVDSKKAEWSSPKHARQWKKTIEDYCYPYFGDLPVKDIDTPMVTEALRAIWTTKTETATRVRQRLEAILDYAKTLHYREGENPARWKGHLDKALPKPSKIQKVKHFAAMSYKTTPEYFRVIREKDTIAALALSFLILTATRSSNARGATWSEIDLDNKLWIIPEEKMKAGREFRVPLTDEAIKVLNLAKTYKVEKQDWVFPGLSGKNCVTEAAIRKILSGTNVTMHGFRSTFRDWCAEMTSFSREIAEAALAHALESKTEAAYQRGDLLEKRRKLMEAWSNYLLTHKEDHTNNVTTTRKSVL